MTFVKCVPKLKLFKQKVFFCQIEVGSASPTRHWYSGPSSEVIIFFNYYFTPCREGNDWSYSFCRRQWSLADNPNLRYGALLSFEACLHATDDEYRFVGSMHQIAFADEEKQVSKLETI